MLNENEHINWTNKYVDNLEQCDIDNILNSNGLN